MATTTSRPTHTRSGVAFPYPVKAGAKINQGAIAVLEGGLLEAGKTAAGLTVAGFVAASVDNSGGADGDLVAEAILGCALFDNSGGADAITAADIGSDCFLVDDETVAKTNGGNTRSRAGLIRGVETGGVWVTFDGRK